MRILIVNAHGKAPESQKAFQDLLACIKEVLRSHNGLLEIQDEYIVRTRENLEDFLYDDHTSFSQPGPGKKFDSLDFIIVSGDLHSLPWHPANIKVLTLLRMCLKVKKCLFAIGFAMQALIYLSASNLEHHVNIINGDGKGGKLGDLGKLHLPPDQIGNQDLFLDNVTGDLYHFQYESNEWAPLCNIGMHHNRTAQEYNTIGKYVIKTPIYRPKKALDASGNSTMIDENNELKCYIKKVFLKHWLFQNCDTGFIVPCRGRWENHAFNFTNKEKTFEVLAESDNGALVIEYPRIIGVKFLVTKRYKETYQLFSNFIVKYADDIICKGKSQNMSILSHVSVQPQTSFRFQARTPEMEIGSARSTPFTQKALQGFRHRKLSELQQTVPDEPGKVFKHSGLASKMKGKFILETNFISGMKVRYDSQNHTPIKETGKHPTKETIMGKYSLMPKKFQTEDDLSFLDEKKKDSFSRGDDRSILRTANNGNHRQTRRSNMKGVSMFDAQRGFKNSMEEDSSLTKEDVRRWLYPDLDGHNSGFERKVWVPGNMTQAKSESFTGSKAIRVSTCSPGYKKRGALPVFNYGIVDTQTVRAADPYKTVTDIMKDHQKKEDEKILGGKKFVLSKGPMSVQSMANTPSSRFGSVISSSTKHNPYYY